MTKQDDGASVRKDTLPKVMEMLREIISDEQRLVEHFQNTPIRVLDGRTMAQALAAGDGEKVLRYLQTISGGQNG